MSVVPKFDPKLLEPPDDATVDRAVADYARLVREAYRSRLKGIYLFGSRARGDHTPESDADVAVVLEDGSWDFWEEKILLTDLTYGLLVESGADLQGWPVRERDWANPHLSHNPALVEAMKSDGRVLGEWS